MARLIRVRAAQMSRKPRLLLAGQKDTLGRLVITRCRRPYEPQIQVDSRKWWCARGKWREREGRKAAEQSRQRMRERLTGTVVLTSAGADQRRRSTSRPRTESSRLLYSGPSRCRQDIVETARRRRVYGSQEEDGRGEEGQQGNVVPMVGCSQFMASVPGI